MTASPVAIYSGGSYIELPMPDYRGYSTAPQEIVKSTRNAQAYLIKYRIAVKQTISITWTNLTAAQKNSVLSLTSGNRFGIRYLDTATDTVKYIPESTGVYRGNDLKIEGHGRYDGSKFQFYDVSMSLVEC